MEKKIRVCNTCGVELRFKSVCYICDEDVCGDCAMHIGSRLICISHFDDNPELKKFCADTINNADKLLRAFVKKYPIIVPSGFA